MPMWWNEKDGIDTVFTFWAPARPAKIVGGIFGMKSTAPVRVKDSILSPMPAPADQLDLTTIERMKRVRDPNLLGRRRSHTTCI